MNDHDKWRQPGQDGVSPVENQTDKAQKFFREIFGREPHLEGSDLALDYILSEDNKMQNGFLIWDMTTKSLRLIIRTNAEGEPEKVLERFNRLVSLKKELESLRYVGVPIEPSTHRDAQRRPPHEYNFNKFDVTIDKLKEELEKLKPILQSAK